MSHAAAAKKVPLRSEVSVADTWDLTRLFPDSAAWEAGLKEYQERYPGYLQFKGTLAESADQLLKCLEFDKELDLLGERLRHYAMLQTAEDSSNHEFLDREARLHQTFTLAAETAAFLTPEILAIPEDRYQGFVAEEKLAPWRTRLSLLRRAKPHILSEAEERLLAMVSIPLHGHDETFNQLLNVDMTF
ncbi:MAG: oligoendopeptidase F, partial [Verrucomicrobiia bacterium]